MEPALVLAKLEGWIVGFQKLLPNIAVVLILALLFYVAGWTLACSFNSWAARHECGNLGEVLGSFLKWLLILVGVLLGLTVVIPSLRPGDLIAGLGIGSVAIGFAFKDILQNWLAGLLLLRQPFRPGDQIVIGDYEGTIVRIETRATIITTYDGRDAIIPNAEVYSNAVTVNTAHEVRRSGYDVGIGYGDDIGRARAAIVAAVSALDEIEPDPAPEVPVWDLAGSSVNLRVRWWTNARRADVVRTRSAVLEAVKAALDADGIDMPYPTQVMLFHDQTEEIDGQRGRQREGWPVRPDETPPSPARLRPGGLQTRNSRPAWSASPSPMLSGNFSAGASASPIPPRSPARSARWPSDRDGLGSPCRFGPARRMSRVARRPWPPR